MTRYLGIALALAVVASSAGVAWSGEQEDFDAIQALAKKGVDVRGMTPDMKTAAIKQHALSLIAKSEKYIADYPKGEHLADAYFFKALGLSYQYRQLGDKDAMPRMIESAGKAMAIGPKTEGAAHAAMLLAGNALHSRDDAELLKLADFLSKNHPASEWSAQVLMALADLYDEQRKTDKALDIYRRIVKECPGSPQAARAQGRLTQEKLKGSTLDLSFTSTDGKKIDMKDLRGKVVVLDFWASWCGPCRVEMPNLVAAYKQFKDQGFQILGINMDQEKPKMEAFMKQTGMTWPQYFDGKGWNNEISRKYGVQAIPFTILVDRKGVVRDIALRGQELLLEVRKLLKEKP